jgi:NAD(P)H dehydrogenase (quinone)
MDAARFAETSEALGRRLDTLGETEPIAFRQQNAGDYDIPALTLRADVAPGVAGFAAHVGAPRAVDGRPAADAEIAESEASL